MAFDFITSLITSARREAGANIAAFVETRQPAVWLLAVVVGLSAGVAAIIFRLAIGLIQWPWLGTVSEKVATAAAEQPWWVIVLTPATGGLVVGLLLRYVLTARRTGSVPDVIESRTASARGLGLRQGLTSALATVVSLGSGASAGREGPMVHLGATLAAAFCTRLDLPNSARRILLACGVAGAVSASFNAPIAGVLFAQEVILAHFAVTSFVPLVLASVSATIVSRLWFGDVAAFAIPPYQITSFLEVPAFAVLGVVAAAVAIIFQVSLLLTDRMARSISLPLVARPVIGGILIGLIALVFPEVLGVGYESTDAALRHHLPVMLMLALLVAKTAATAITLASRFGGGVIAPALYLGAMAGGSFGLMAASVFPEAASSEGLYAILGMGAVAAAVLGAPISTSVMVFELTGGFTLSLALLLTVSIANGLTLAVLGRSWFHTQLESRGVALQGGPHRHLMRTRRVADFMQAAAESDPATRDRDDDSPFLRPQDTLETALRLFDVHGDEKVPVVGDDPRHIVGWASQVKALALFNKELIATSVEEHR
jgi:CIC family chloride channel protein